MAGGPIKVDLERARALFLKKQLLGGSRLPGGKVGALGAIERLGYLQIDTINVIERSHHIVLFTRCPDYSQRFLEELHSKDKKIFEYWAHAASFIPIKDYRFYLRAIERRSQRDSWIVKWAQEHGDLMKKVKSRIVKEGPLTASDFRDTANRRRGGWWDWKPAKMALEVLFWQGDLMIRERRKFQRVYDLTERVLPGDVEVLKPGEREEKEFFIRRALGAMGVATGSDINRYIGVSGRLNEWIQKMAKSKEILEIEVKGIAKPYYILREDLAELEKCGPKADSRVSFLSPFDNLIILRDRTSALFQFNYSLEAYVPKNRRKFGYFCLPILWGTQLVGRIDPKVDRRKKTLLLRHVHLESKELSYDRFFSALSRALSEFGRFHDCERVELSEEIPARIRRGLQRDLPRFLGRGNRQSVGY
jgi:uncharacterized protein YcaQ